MATVHTTTVGCLLLGILATPAGAFNVPLAALSSRVASRVVQEFAPVPSPFALSEAFGSSVFGGPQEGAVSQLTITWDSEKEASVKDLIELALSTSALSSQMRIVSVSQSATYGVKVVILGVRRSCRAFIELAALNNLAVQSATWS